MSDAYLVTTPLNPDYAGSIFGLKFYAGKAVLSEEMLNKRLGYTVEEIKRSLLRDYKGYEVKPLSNRAQAALQAVLEAENAEALAGTGAVEEEKKASKTKKE